MKTPRRDWRHSSEECWLQATLLFSLALVGFRGKLISGLPLLSRKGDSKVLEQLLRLLEVRALGTLSFPAARVAVWLAQEEREEAPASPISGAADGGSRRCREAREPLLAAQRQSRRPRPPRENLEAGAASPDPGEKKRGLSPEAVDLKGRQDYLEYCYLLPKENEHSRGEGQRECDKTERVDWKERDHPTSAFLDHRSTIDSSFSLEGYFPKLTSLSEIALEEHVSNTGGVNLTNVQNPIDLAQAISHDVSLHDATVMGSDHPNVTNAERRNLERLEILPDLNTYPTNGTNMLELFAYDNCCRNLTNQDFFFSLNANRFEEINFTSLTMEENFDSAETCLFEEWDSDSGLSLDLNYSNSSLVFTYNKGAKCGTSDDLGTIGDSCLEHGKYCHTEYQSNYDYGTESLVSVFHDHTYNQNIQQLTLSTSQDYFRWPEESKRTEKDKNLNDDEYRAKALRIPFSVNDIVTLPVESFNSMLSNYYLTANQLSLIRDIRRRGKNKVAAQNCRKRKLDAIMNLKDEVYHLQMQMERLKKQKAQYKRSIGNVKQKLNDLCWDFFSKLRDDQGKSVNPSQYTLQCCGNGIMLILPEKEINLEPKQLND
ncbi:nuclear factor erythroid 2-related factor 3 [Candoia aspera]|uniref:nuclear factor erythroid 2-related factor 3 n=1 Tax=Candoia aspera TaxID=51853 RepID=UPI002FD80F28